jgi:hypothetical protein
MAGWMIGCRKAVLCLIRLCRTSFMTQRIAAPTDFLRGFTGRLSLSVH